MEVNNDSLVAFEVQKRTFLFDLHTNFIFDVQLLYMFENIHLSELQFLIKVQGSNSFGWSLFFSEQCLILLGHHCGGRASLQPSAFKR